MATGDVGATGGRRVDVPASTVGPRGPGLVGGGQRSSEPVGAGLRRGLVGPDGRADPQAVKNAFEALLLAQLLKPLQDSLQSSGLFPQGAPGEIYGHLWQTQMGEMLAAEIDLLPGWSPAPEADPPAAEGAPEVVGGETVGPHGVPKVVGGETVGPHGVPKVVGGETVGPHGVPKVVGGETVGPHGAPDAVGGHGPGSGPASGLGSVPGGPVPLRSAEPIDWSRRIGLISGLERRHASGSAGQPPSVLRPPARPRAVAALEAVARAGPERDAVRDPERDGAHPLADTLRPHERTIQRAARASGIGANWLRAVIIQESAGRADAVSRKGAQGLMQLLPATAQALGVSDPLEPAQNVAGGARYLRSLFDRYGDPHLALAAYNAGPGRVEAYGGVPPFPETRHYVERVMTLKASFDKVWPSDGGPASRP